MPVTDKTESAFLGRQASDDSTSVNVCNDDMYYISPTHLHKHPSHFRVVRAADLKSVGPGFNFSATLVNRQLICLPPVGMCNIVMFI